MQDAKRMFVENIDYLDDYIHTLFMSVFHLQIMMEKMPDTSDEDALYTIANDKFMEIAEMVEHIISWICYNDNDDTKWYDAYHDDFVLDFCGIIKSAELEDM